MINCHRKTLRKRQSIAHHSSILHHRLNISHIIIRSKRLHQLLKRRHIGIQSIDHRLKFLESLPCGNLDQLTSDERKTDTIRIRHIHSLEERSSILTIFRNSLVKLHPCGTIVRRHIPEPVLDLQHRRNSILTVCTRSAIGTISTWDTRSTRNTVSAIAAVRSRRTCCRNPATVLIKHPRTVNRPIPPAVCILHHSDNRRMSIRAVRAIRTRKSRTAVSTISTVTAMINAHRLPLREPDYIAHNHTILNNISDTGNIIIVLKSRHNPLLGRNLIIEPAADLLQFRNAVLMILQLIPNRRVVKLRA